MLQIQTFNLGPIKNNVYVVFDDQTLEAVVIDPSLEPELVGDFIQQKSLNLLQVWITHGHFDHYYGLPFLEKTFPSIKNVYLHPDDLELWRSGGGAKNFWNQSIAVTDPNQMLASGQKLWIGEHEFSVRHVPGHSEGCVLFYSSELKCAFVGDTIFYHGIGRTFMASGDYSLLIHSIQTQIFTLPDETILYPGHGPFTTVAEEKANNPYM